MAADLMYLNLVPKVGLEPSLLSEAAFETATSTNFITQALIYVFIITLLSYFVQLSFIYLVDRVGFEPT